MAWPHLSSFKRIWIFIKGFEFSLVLVNFWTRQVSKSLFFMRKIDLFVELLLRGNRFDKLRWKIHLGERVMENPIILHHLSRWAPSLVWEPWRLLSASRYAFTHTITKGDEPNSEVTHGERIWSKYNSTEKIARIANSCIVSLYCQVTLIVMTCNSQLSEICSCSQKFTVCNCQDWILFSRL